MKRIYEDFAYGEGPVERCYWRATVPDEPGWACLDGEVRSDVAIVGGGYTGLNAALALAEAGVDVAVIEARTPGWGASGRNGGFCCLGGAKLSEDAIVRRFGAEEARLFDRAQADSVDHVAGLLARFGIDADTHSAGETQLAHRAQDAVAMRARAEASDGGHVFHSRDQLRQHGLHSEEFHGALTTPKGFALNPLKYVRGLAAAAKSSGATIFANAPVTGIERASDAWILRTDHGEVRARRLLMATNGYSSDALPGWMRARYLPVQSNILVTREMTADELAAQGWTSNQMCYDTRNLVHYFRLMPNNRMLFGLRGTVRATPESFAATRARARADFDRIFPAWRAVETPYFWSGLVAMSRRLTPFVGPMGDMPDAFAAMCYHGNGVAMGSYSGALAADLLMRRESARAFPAFMRSDPGRFPFGRFRRAALPAAFRWYKFQDRG